jgi:AraC family transcriptional regulator, ethanolamine operon transcriptional activator
METDPLTEFRKMDPRPPHLAEPRPTPPVVTAVEIGDPTAAGEGIEVLTQEVVKLKKEPLRVKRFIIRLGRCTVVMQSTNLRVRTRTTLHGHQLAYVVFGPRTKGWFNGLPVRPELMLAAEVGAQVKFVAEPGYESLTMLVPKDAIEAHSLGRQHGGPFRAPRGLEMLDVGGGGARGLFEWGKRLATAAARRPALFDGREEAPAAAQVELMEMLLAALDASSRPVLSRGDRTRQAHDQIVQLAENYALAQVDAVLYVKDLCIATGVSERTLEYAFREATGMGPVAYLARLRLHRARRALRMAVPGSTTVTAEALNWGFTRFGEFARAYNECFGELPSTTLRRTPPASI